MKYPAQRNGTYSNSSTQELRSKARRLSTRFSLVILATTAATQFVHAQHRFPSDAGHVNVIDHGAAPDDGSDDTAAINAAIDHAIRSSNRYRTPRIVYLPAGTYRVSGPIEGRISDHDWSGGWRAGMMLIGDGADRTILKLDDHAPGYGDPEKPKWVVASGSENNTRGREKNTMLGGGNEAFHHYLEGFTVDVGSGNPGAIALDFVASNRGAVTDITLRAGEGSGYCGLSLERWWPGPCLIRGVTVEGFAFGVRAHHYQYGVTFQDLTLRGQREAGIHNSHNMLAIERLRSENAVPVYKSTSRHGLLVLLNAEMRGGDRNQPAITGNSRLYLRDVKIDGYGIAFDDQSAKRQGRARHVKFYASNPKTMDAPARPLGLRIAEPPVFDVPPVDQWVSVGDHGAVPNDQQDDTAAIQAAIDTGATVVYLPNGRYRLNGTIELHGPVRWFVGMQAHLAPLSKEQKVEPMVRYTGGAGEATKLQFFHIDGSVEHAGAGTWTIAHSVIARGKGYANSENGTGDMFFEDVIVRPIKINYPQNVWGRQVNSEFGAEPYIENRGGNLWLFNLKTESNRETALVRQTAGNTEIIGGLFYNTTHSHPLQGPALINEGGSMAATFVMNGKGYRRYLGRAYEDDRGVIGAKQVGGRAAALVASKVRQTPRHETPLGADSSPTNP